MAQNRHCKLTLEQPVEYRIQVPGHLDGSWLGGFGELTVETGQDEADWPITILTGSFDQAALIGLLRKLYSLGLPLISAICLEA